MQLSSRGVPQGNGVRYILSCILYHCYELSNSMNNQSTPSWLLITTVICLGAIAAVLILTSAPPDTTAQSGYPAPAATTAPAYPPPNNTPVASTATPTVPTVPTVPATATRAPETPTPPPTIRPTLTSTSPPTPFPSATPQFAQIVDVTPTPPGVLECAPGQTLMIGGMTSPYAPLIISFGARIVGGGSARASGEFALPLTIGMERAGEYQVTVRVRNTGEIVRSLTCRVPPTTPTPVLRRLR